MLQVEEAFAACIRAVTESVSFSGFGTPSWTRSVFFEAGSSGNSTGWQEELQSRALGRACYSSLSDEAYLLPLAAMLATIASAEERLEAIRRGLKGSSPARSPSGPPAPSCAWSCAWTSWWMRREGAALLARTGRGRRPADGGRSHR